MEFAVTDNSDIAEMLQQAQRLQQEMADAQERLAAAVLEGRAANGRVKVSVDGMGSLLSLQLAPELLTTLDADSLSAAIMEALRKADLMASDLQGRTMRPITGEFK